MPHIPGINPTIPTLSRHELSRASAVCMVFLETTPKEPAQVLFTRRSLSVASHKGQVSFPGGRFEESSDQTLLQTALRELREEVGMELAETQFIGCLPRVRALDTSPVIPFVFSTQNPLHSLTTDPTEVAQIFSLPWPCLTQKQSKAFQFVLFGLSRESKIYRGPQGEKIWGLTANILFEANLCPYEA